MMPELFIVQSKSVPRPFLLELGRSRRYDRDPAFEREFRKKNLSTSVTFSAVWEGYGGGGSPNEHRVAA
jgi:hypothetical protein